MSLSPMSYVEFKKWPCRPVGFRGQRPKSYIGVHGMRGNTRLLLGLAVVGQYRSLYIVSTSSDHTGASLREDREVGYICAHKLSYNSDG